MKNEKKCVYSILNENSDQDSKSNISRDIIYKNYKDIHEATSSFNSESVLGDFFITLLDQLPVANHVDILSHQLRVVQSGISDYVCLPYMPFFNVLMPQSPWEYYSVW